MCPCRRDSHQSCTKELAGNCSFPQVSFRKSSFCRKGCVPHACTAKTVSGLKCHCPLLLVMALPFFSLKRYFISKQSSLRFKRDSKAPQYISKGLKPDGSQITCFPFFFRMLFHKKKEKKNSIELLSQCRARVFSPNSQNLSSESLSLFWPAPAGMRGWKISGGNVKAC